MVLKEKLYTVDDLWAMEHDPAFEQRKFYLIDGRLYEEEMPGRIYARLALKIGRYLDEYAEARGLGEVTVECGYHPADTRYTLLLPDVGFQRFENVPDPPPAGYVPRMPDIAVEIQSPSDSLTKLRHKAQTYLLNGTSIVWLVLPDRRGVEVCRLLDGTQLQIEFVSSDGTLSGEGALPGFELDVSKIFAVLRN